MSGASAIRAIFIIRIFESKFRSHCAKKLDVHEEKPPPSLKNSSDSSSKFEDSQLEDWPYRGFAVIETFGGPTSSYRG